MNLPGESEIVPSETGSGRRRNLVLCAVFVFLFAGIAGLLSSIQPSLVPPQSVAAQAIAMLRGYKREPLTKPLADLLAHPKQYYVPSIDHSLVGQQAPDFELQNWRGNAVRLSRLLQDGPVVLVFYLGYWCDHCVVQLFDLDEEIEQFRELRANVVAVSPDTPDETVSKFREFGRFRLEVLSDPDQTVAEAYDCFDPTSGGGPGKLFHGSFVIDSSGKIVWADISEQPFRSVRTLLFEVAKLQGRLP